MESQLSLTALQTELFWEDKKKNFHHLERQQNSRYKQMLSFSQKCLPLVLTMEAENRQVMDGKTAMA